VQLCAQAICLEEMLSEPIPCGSIFYGQPRRREEVPFSEELRALVRTTAARLHELVSSGLTPSPRYDTRCQGCSLVEACLPHSLESRGSAAAYLVAAFSAEADELPAAKGGAVS
jgi:CRISPR-associated exonuclease Cas4